VTSTFTSEPFWSAHQPGFRFTDEAVGTPDFFAAVERHRYRLEPHIPAIARFEQWRERDVLEVGCGIATDGLNFARAGARYTGVDQSPHALDLARRRFALEHVRGDFATAQAFDLPFAEDSFDLVFSHGVIHHFANAEDAVSEFRRVLRPGGTALVMVYHRNSLNYRFTIMIVRRTLAVLLLLPGVAGLLARITGEEPWVLDEQKLLLRRYGLRYIRDGSLFLSNNTDGPGNPLSRVYSRKEAVQLFKGFQALSTEVRFLNLRIYPQGEKLASSAVAKRLERRLGWHLYVRGTKPSPSVGAGLSASGEMTAAEANRILYAEIAGTYDLSEECVVDERLRLRLRAALLRARDCLGAETPRVLDACGGSGNASLMLLSLGLRPVTVDISAEMLAIYAKKALARKHAPECVVCELEDFLRGEQREWDMIVFSSALHHFENPAAVLALARTRVAAGGVIVTMFDPIRASSPGRKLRRVDYLLHVAVRTPERLLGSVRARLRRREESAPSTDRVVGEMAERHALAGLDDMAIQRAFVEDGWSIVEHERRYEGRFQITRLIFHLLRQRSSFSLIAQAPLTPPRHGDC
jgi:ubiquinone/menaquinone biosynthesis C-methylase UbiE